MSGGLLGLDVGATRCSSRVPLCGFTAALPIVLGHAGGISGTLANSNVPSNFRDFYTSSGPGSGWTFLIALGPAFIISAGADAESLWRVERARRETRHRFSGRSLWRPSRSYAPLFGMAARALHPGITDPNLVLPTLLVERLSPALGALALAAVFSAEVNTCDALLFVLSTSLSQDLYKRFCDHRRAGRNCCAWRDGRAFASGVGGVLFAPVSRP